MRRLPTACLLVLAACPGKHHDFPAPLTQCATPVRESVLPDDMVQDLGTLAVGTDATFVVTAGTSSFFIFSQEADGSAPDTVFVAEPGFTGRIPNAVVPTDLRAPGETTPWYDDVAQWGTLDSVMDGATFLGYEVSAQSVSEAFPVPNTSGALAKIASDGGLKPGTWHFTVNDWARQCPFMGCADGNTSGRYRVQVVTRAASAQPTLDLEVYLATDPMSVLATALAANADAQGQVARWKEGLGHYLGNAGISLGNVHFNDLAQEVKAAYAPNGTVDVTNGGPCGDLSQLFTSAKLPKRAVHVFLADELVAPTASGTDAIVVGVDGSIPGPSGFPGTINGGAIVGLFGEFGHEERAFPGACTSPVPNLHCGTDVLAYIAAHEIGHWLGLYHTTESDGAFFDPISDTDRCPCLQCGSNCSTSTANVNASQCMAGPSCGGGANLMFWLLDERYSAGAVSPNQGKIMQLNPAVR